MNAEQIQAMVDALSKKMERERAETQMTLGEMIRVLAALPADTQIASLVEPHSYRGFYTDLAFERAGGTMCAADLLELCKSVMGQIFEGYKGGDFMMGATTPVWVASWGETGDRLMSIRHDGSIETAPYEI